MTLDCLLGRFVSVGDLSTAANGASLSSYRSQAAFSLAGLEAKPMAAAVPKPGSRGNLMYAVEWKAADAGPLSVLPASPKRRHAWKIYSAAAAKTAAASLYPRRSGGTVGVLSAGLAAIQQSLEMAASGTHYHSSNAPLGTLTACSPAAASGTTDIPPSFLSSS